jgi:lysylphosphatidylglycerol synthetase-like protein (DUF2156 family)
MAFAIHTAHYRVKIIKNKKIRNDFLNEIKKDVWLSEKALREIRFPLLLSIAVEGST